MCLYLESTQQLRKNSYVKLKPHQTIKAALLKPLGRKHKYQLSAKSLQELIQRIGFESPWPSTIHVHQPVRYELPIRNSLQPVLSLPRVILHEQPIPKSLQPALHPPRVTLHEQPIPKSLQPALNPPQVILIPRPVHNPMPEFGCNRPVPAIASASRYQRPVGWASPQDRSTYPYPSHEQTPLLQPVHRTVIPHIQENHEGGSEILRFLVIVAVLVFLAWYFDVFR